MKAQDLGTVEPRVHELEIGQVQQMEAIKRLEQQLAANNELMKNRFDTVILQLELKSR